MKFSKRLYMLALQCLLGLACASAAQATPLGFNGFYDYSTWTSTATVGGPVYSSVDASHQTLTMMEPDGCVAGCFAQEFQFSHVVAASGTVSFDWIFDARVDACCSGLNFYINGTLYNLTGGTLADPYGNFPTSPIYGYANGSFSAAVNAGDTITFAAMTADSCCRASTNIISAFDAPTTDLPEPSTIAILGLGLAGVGMSRRKWLR